MEPSQQHVDMYINQLSKQERIALNIAQDLLKSSFSIKKSLGFINWFKTIQKQV